MATHRAVATVGIKKPLAIIQNPTIPPKGDEVLFRVEWTASTPLDLHQNDGGFLVQHPQVLGDTAAGIVVEVGSDVRRLQVGDKVFGFVWRESKEKGQQEFVTAPEWLFGLIPEGFSMPEAVTLPNNFVTVFHSMTMDLGIELPWPRPDNYIPAHVNAPLLIWGGSSSVGQFAIQILRYYGFQNILATASTRHHDLLRSYGAAEIFDYRSDTVVEYVLKAATDIVHEYEAPIPFIVDCIGSMHGSIFPITKLAKKGSKVAILLPVIVRDSSETQDPIYELDVSKCGVWEPHVEVKGVRTHFYLQNEFFKYHLQSDIMPAMLKDGIVKPNKQRIVEGKTLLERAQNALDALRRKEVSGERLVWRVASGSD